MRTYKALKITLVSIGNDTIDTKHVAQAADLLGQINTFEFILMMYLMIEVLEQTHDLSQLLQCRGQDLGNAATKVASTVSRLRTMQSDDENFMKIYDQAEKFARDNAIVVPDRSETMFQHTQDIRTWLPSTNINQQRKLDALNQELKAFANYITMGKFDKLQNMQDVLQLLERDYHDLPMMQELYQIAITILVSSASPERPFSAMKRILNCLRASMGSK
ncbi:unnamed protein product [Sphagnum tenellum]